MVNDRRVGATYFLIITLCERGARVSTNYIEALHVSIQIVKRLTSFQIDAIEVLPDNETALELLQGIFTPLVHAPNGGIHNTLQVTFDPMHLTWALA